MSFSKAREAKEPQAQWRFCVIQESILATSRKEGRDFLLEGVFEALPFIFSHMDSSIGGRGWYPSSDFFGLQTAP